MLAATFIALVLGGGTPPSCEYSGHVTVSRDERAPATGPIVVTLEPVAGSPRTRPPAPLTVFMHQQNFAFSPPFLVVNKDDTVAFQNDDPDYHSVFSSAPDDPFEMPESRKSVSGQRKFAVAGMEHIQCNIHSKMRAEILVLKLPFYSLADAAGNWRIQAPGGKWSVVAIEPNGGRTEQLVSGCVSSLELVLPQAPKPSFRRKDGSLYKQYDE
jgi:plastocyanin